MPCEKTSRHTVGGMTAGAALGAVVAGPGGAVLGGLAGGLVGIPLDEAENRERRRTPGLDALDR